MTNEYSTSRIPLSVLSNPRASRTTCQDVRLCAGRLQPLSESPYRFLVRKTGKSRVQRYSKTSHKIEATRRNSLVTRRFKRLPSTILTQSGYRVQELLPGSSEIPGFQEEERKAMRPLHDQRLHVQGRENQAGKTQSTFEHKVEPKFQRNPYKLHSQSGHGWQVSHFYLSRGRSKDSANCEEGSRNRPGFNSCSHNQRWQEGRQPALFSKTRKAFSESSAFIFTEEERRQEPRKGAAESRKDSCEDCRSTYGLLPQAHDTASQRKPSNSCREFAGKESAQEPEIVKGNIGCWMVPDNQYAGIQIQLVRAFFCPDRQILSIKQALPCLWAYLRQNAAISSFLGLSFLRQSTRPGHKRCEEHYQGRKGHSFWRRPVESSRKEYGRAYRILSLWSLHKTEVEIYGGSGL